MGIEKSVRSRTARLRECSSWKSLLHLHDDDKINLLFFFSFTAPAKHNAPTVEPTGIDKVRVICEIAVGGGYTHEFLVQYRQKCMLHPCISMHIFTHCLGFSLGEFA